MRRRLFNIACLLSLVLFLVVVGSWWKGTGFDVSMPRWLSERHITTSVFSYDGPVEFVVTIATPRIYGTWGPAFRVVDWGGLGFTFRKYDWWRSGSRNQPAKTDYVITCPHWFLAMLLSILPTIWIIRYQRRPKPGHCKCGYDLRGNPDAVVCPECGEAAAVARAG